MVENNKKLWMIGAAGAVLVGAALLYMWASSGEDDSAADAIKPGDSAKLEKDLTAADLGTVKRSAQGMLDSQYFLKLLQFVG